MLKRFTFLLLLLPLIGFGQETSVLPELLATSPEAKTEAAARIDRFVSQLPTAGQSSDAAYLKKVFHKTEKTFLREYIPYSPFTEIFESGKFDCLTATSLFSIVLDRLHFRYRIIETNYHIFLLVKTSEGEVLLETTDRFSGFVKNQKDIQARIGTYRESLATVGDQPVFHYSFDLYNEVSPRQLPGLLYYNQAVKSFNAGELEKCGELLARAQSIYSTPRINEFGFVFLQTVADSQLDSPTKQRIILQFKNLISRRSSVLASR